MSTQTIKQPLVGGISTGRNTWAGWLKQVWAKLLLGKKKLLLGGGLNFDDLSSSGHYQIHVDFGAGVLFITEVEHDFAVHDADASGGDKVTQWDRGERSGFHEPG